MFGIARDGVNIVVPAREINAAIAQLGERQTEDLKVPGSIPGLGTFAQLLPVLNSGSHPDGGQFLVQSPRKVSFPPPSGLGPIVLAARPARIGLSGGGGASGGEPEPIRGTWVRSPGAPGFLSTCLCAWCLSVCLSFCLCLCVWLCVSVLCVCLPVRVVFHNYECAYASGMTIRTTWLLTCASVSQPFCLKVRVGPLR